jgi:hypothetical protein
MPIPFFPFPARYNRIFLELMLAGKGSKKERGPDLPPFLVPGVK